MQVAQVFSCVLSVECQSVGHVCRREICLIKNGIWHQVWLSSVAWWLLTLSCLMSIHPNHFSLNELLSLHNPTDLGVELLVVSTKWKSLPVQPHKGVLRGQYWSWDLEILVCVSWWVSCTLWSHQQSHEHCCLGMEAYHCHCVPLSCCWCAGRACVAGAVQFDERIIHVQLPGPKCGGNCSQGSCSQCFMHK